jgi:hypothetical protein
MILFGMIRMEKKRSIDEIFPDEAPNCEPESLQ